MSPVSGEEEKCQHQWEDAQLRATKDGAYILSVDYCPLCGLHDLSYRLNSLQQSNDALATELQAAREALREIGDNTSPAAVEKASTETVFLAVDVHQCVADFFATYPDKEQPR